MRRSESKKYINIELIYKLTDSLLKQIQTELKVIQEKS